MITRGARIADRYVVGDTLGAGGMGIVVCAFDERLERDVAVKILPPDAVGDDLARERLLREARAAAALEHPNIVHIYDVGETEDGSAYLVMELVRGETMRRRLARGIAPAEALALLVDVARALGSAHQAGFVHRDVKPDNLMVREDGRVVVLDFGIAKTVEKRAAGDGLTAEGQVVGTPSYLAPEQARGDEIDAHTDQFALAVTVYEALTGRVPWKSATSLAIVAEILRDEPDPPTSRSPGLPAALDEVVGRALSKDPAARYPDMDAFADALAALTRSFGGRSVPPTPPASAPTESAPVDPLAPTMVDDPPTVPLPITPPATPAATEPRPRESAAEPVTEPPAITPANASITRPLSRHGAAPRAPAGRRAWLPLVLAVVGAVVAFFLYERGPRAPLVAAHDASAPPRATAVTDLPIPPSTSAAAVAAYREGLQASRDANASGIRRAFRRAVELDPSMGMAWFRLADILWAMNDTKPAVDAFEKALGQRATMTERDVDMVMAEEPAIRRTPPDYAEALRRYEALATKWPRDAEVHQSLAFMYYSSGQLAQTHGPARRAIELDPTFASAWLVEGLALLDEHHHDEAMRAFEKCREVSPLATTCIMNIAFDHANRGECGRVLERVAGVLDANPSSADAQMLRVNAMAANGADVETLRPVLRQWAIAAPDLRGFGQVLEARLSLLGGDFDAAGASLREAATQNEGTTDDAVQQELFGLQIVAALESGREQDARRLVSAFLKQRGLWRAARRSTATFRDHTGEILIAARDLGLLAPDAWRRERDLWLEDWRRALPAAEIELWTMAYAVPAATKADADEALTRLPSVDLGKIDDVGVLGPAGLVLALAGRNAEAVGMLDRASKTCMPFESIARHVRVLAARGAVAEAQDDPKSACAAYRGVLDRWGKAKPRSVTAERVARRWRALGCAAK